MYTCTVYSTAHRYQYNRSPTGTVTGTDQQVYCTVACKVEEVYYTVASTVQQVYYTVASSTIQQVYYTVESTIKQVYFTYAGTVQQVCFTDASTVQQVYFTDARRWRRLWQGLHPSLPIRQIHHQFLMPKHFLHIKSPFCQQGFGLILCQCPDPLVVVVGV